MALRACSVCPACQASMSAWRQADRVRSCPVSHRRKAVACLTWSPAWRRLAGVIGFFSARARSRGRTSQVAKRRTTWAWSGSAMPARWPASHRSNEQICLSMAGSTPQAISSSRRWAAARQGWRAWNASWVSSISPRPRRRSRSSADRCGPCGCRARSGRTAGGPWRGGIRPAGRVQGGSGRCRRPGARRAGRQRCSERIAGHRAVCPPGRSVRRRRTARIRHRWCRSRRRRRGDGPEAPVPGRSRDKPPGSAPRGPGKSGRRTRPASCRPFLRRPQRQHSVMYQRSYCSSVA